MLKKATMSDALRSTSPSHVSLICTETPDGETNLATVAWWTYLESDPPMIGFSMAKESYTCELLQTNNKVVVTIPGEGMADEAFRVGVVSGRDVDKVKAYNIELVSESPLKYPKHSRVAFICHIDQRVICGDCVFFVCNVDDIMIDEDEKQIFAWSGADKLSTIN